MRRLDWSRLFIAGLVAGSSVALSAPGCFAVANLDRFHGSEAGVEAATDDPALALDLKLTMTGMGVHLNQLIEFRIIDSQNYVQSRGVIEPVNDVASENVTFTVPKAIPTGNRPYRLDFYADVNDTRSFDGLDTGIYHDHAWRIEPLADYPEGKFPHVANQIQVIFSHNRVFTDINEWPSGSNNPPQDTGLGVLVEFPAANLVEFVGKLCQVRIVEARSGHVVGLYRNPEIPAADFDGFIPGVVEAGEDYDIDVYIDANGNGSYDNPKSVGGLDLGWRFTQAAAFPDSDASSDADGDSDAAGNPSGVDPSLVGLHLTFDPKEKPGVEDIGEP